MINGPTEALPNPANASVGNVQKTHYQKEIFLDL
jgi:hypothetical protein